MSESEFADIERVDPVESLVLFKPLKRPVVHGQSCIAKYDVGKEFQGSTWDWVGLYPQDWKTVYDYKIYHWAPAYSDNPRLPHRRSILFSADDLAYVSDWDTNYQFLYVTYGHHVVGVSSPFQLLSEEESEDDLCFDWLERSVIPSPIGPEGVRDVADYSLPEPFTRCPDCDSRGPSQKCIKCELLPGFKGDLDLDKVEKRLARQAERESCALDEPLPLPPTYFAWTDASTDRKRKISHPKLLLDSPPKKMATKQKVFTVLRDTTTLTTNFPDSRLPSNLLQILLNHPVVKKYEQMNNLALPPPSNHMSSEEKTTPPVIKQSYDMPLKKTQLIFDITKSDRQEANALSKKDNTILSLEYPARLSLLPGPESILQNLQENAVRCSGCLFGKNLVTEAMEQNRKSQQRVKQLRNMVKALRRQVKIMKRKKSEVLQAKKQQEKALEERCAKFKQLESQVCVLEMQLAKLKQHDQVNLESASDSSRHSLTDKCLQDAFMILKKQGFSHLVDENGEKFLLSSLGDEGEEAAGWTTRIPKRLERLRQVVSNQSSTIQSLTQSVITQRDNITRLVDTIVALRKCNQDLTDQHMEKDRKLSDMTTRTRHLLRDRSHDFTNEWRLFARSLNKSNIVQNKKDRVEELKSKAATTARKLSTKKGKTLVQVNKSTLCIVESTNKSSQTSLDTCKRCPTCKMVFSPDVDSRAMEEHIVFHQNYGSIFSQKEGRKKM